MLQSWLKAAEGKCLTSPDVAYLVEKQLRVRESVVFLQMLPSWLKAAEGKSVLLLKMLPSRLKAAEGIRECLISPDLAEIS